MIKNKKNLDYQALVTLINNAETISWNRFNSFLVFNSILILGWVAIYNNIEKQPIVFNLSLLLGSICILGLIISFFWSTLGFRGRSNVNLFLRIGEIAEKKYESKIKVITAAKNLSEEQPFSWSGSFYVLTITPLLIAFLYTLFLWFSISSLLVKTILISISITSIIVFACLLFGNIRRNKQMISNLLVSKEPLIDKCESIGK